MDSRLSIQDQESGAVDGVGELGFCDYKYLWLAKLKVIIKIVDGYADLREKTADVYEVKLGDNMITIHQIENN